MYPKNNATPERIAIGQVVLIADGTIQSAAVVVTVRGQGGAEAGSAGTIAFGADNTVYYTPTQAETNFTSFTVIASKASCFSVSQTVVTTASSTPGLVVLAATGLDLIVSTATGMVEIAKAIWDRVLTGATHNINNSAGKRVRTLGSNAIFSGTASAGDADSITLAGGSSVDGLYVGAGINIQEGTGAGQSRYIVSYDGTTKIAEVARHWTVNPSSDSEFVITPDHQIDFIDMGVAQAGGATSITLATTAEAVDDTYKGTAIRVMSGTGDHQIRMITAYNGTTKVATVHPAWETNPDSTSSYATLNTGPANVVTVGNTAQTANDNGEDINAILDAVATSGVVLDAAQMNAIADHVIRRNSANARASSDGDTVTFRSILGGVSKLTNKVHVVSTDLITREEDDSTSFGVQAITTDASAEPITALDTT